MVDTTRSVARAPCCPGAGSSLGAGIMLSGLSSSEPQPPFWTTGQAEALDAGFRITGQPDDGALELSLEAKEGWHML